MSELSKQALQVENTQSFPNNTTGYITPTLLRTFNSNAIDSTVNQTVYTSDSGSWNTKINNLNAFTASQQPSFTALNSFTASQLTINSGVNLFTQSAASSISQLNVQTASFYAFTASVNQVMEEGTVLGYSTRFNYRGLLISASVTPNVSGLITNIDVISDSTKTNTSSFNEFTASTNQQLDSLETNSASVNISVAALNNYTTSVGPVATGSLLLTASFLENTITFTKGNNSIFYVSGFANAAVTNAYSASTNIRLNNLEVETANLEIFTSSQLTINTSTGVSIAALNTYSASASSSIFNLNAFTSSQNTKNATLAAVTASLLASQSAYDTKWATLSDVTSSLISKTGSYATTGSNTFIGNQILMGSLIASGSLTITGSLTISSSADIDLNVIGNTTIAGNTTITGSLTLSSSALVELNVIGNTTITGSSLFTGSVTVTGSVVGNVVSMSIASNTASMDLNRGNFFTLTLVSGSATRLEASNIKAGQTINLLVSQPSVGTGTINYNSTFKWPLNNAYTASVITGSKDIVSFISFDGSALYGTAIKNLV
jgi:hypothetical protein